VAGPAATGSAPAPVAEPEVAVAAPAVPTTAAAEPSRPATLGAVNPGEDPGTALERLASGVGDPALAAELGRIAAALRGERQVREEERGRAAATAITAGAQLARVYRRDAADLRRLETAAGVCGEDAACRERYGPALARAATARELTRDAYIQLVGQVAADYPQALLDRELAAAAAAATAGGTARGNPAEAAALHDLARRFVDQVGRQREGAAAGGPESVAAELLADGGPPGPPDAPSSREGTGP
jgi:hypothetical protein